MATEPRDGRTRRTISLFSGAMGLDIGLEASGLSTAVALECNKFALETIKRNRKELPVIAGRIEDVTSETILERSRLAVGDAFAVVGGPSCQVFSTAGQRRSLADPRATMFEDYVRVIRDTRPKFFVMENVRGLISAARRHRPLGERGPGFPPLEEDEQLGSAFSVVAEKLSDLGYYCVFDVLNAADYGVPQTRQRLVILGSRDGHDLRMPIPTHSGDEMSGLSPWQTLGEAIEGVPTGERDYYTFCPSKSKYLEMVPEGGNWRDLPENLKREALGRAFESWGGRSGFFRRLSRGRPSPALTTRPDSKATTLCHPTELRPLSVPEYAAVQQFPPGWVFEGPIRKQYEQVGNAVPTGLGEAVGRALLTAEDTPTDEARKGRFECFNLDLLYKLSRRPKTVVNPPRMRGKGGSTEALTEWLGDAGRLRQDVVAYVPQELEEEFSHLIYPKRKSRGHSGSAEDQAVEDGAGHEASQGELRLTAAE